MEFSLTEQHRALQTGSRQFAQEHLAPRAGEWDRSASFPRDAVLAMAARGYLGLTVPEAYGGAGLDNLSLAILCEQLGRACMSSRTLVTVHGMVTHALCAWGDADQRARWLPELAAGRLLGAFALTEPEVGSDAARVQCEIRRDGDGYVVRGQKKWISFGQIADVFLVIAQLGGQPLACLVERGTEGVRTEPITGVLGSRASMLASISFDECRIGREHVLGGPGFGFIGVALSALNVGRLTVGTGAVGVAQACIDQSQDYVAARAQFGRRIGEHQLVRRLLAEMRVKTTAARLLCYRAAWLLDKDDEDVSTEIMAAKYYAAQIANDIARDAVQIHGANGYSEQYAVERYFRDAKCLEIIEGTREVLQFVLGAPDARWGRVS